MANWYYKIGQMAGKSVRKGKWVFESVTGTEDDAVRAEYKVGRDLAQEVQKEAGVDADPKARELIDSIGPALVKRVKNKARRFQFWVADSEGEPNAFALPGGFIFLTRPLLDLCEWDRDGVAFILGHEMGHVVRKHAVNRIIHNWSVNAASRALPVRGAVGGLIKKVGLGAVTSAYSQENELEADAFGAKLAHAAGFDAGASIDMLARLRDLAARGDGSTVGEYFTTHPPFDTRIEHLRKLVG